jgi:hypothetical protein
LAIDAVLVVDEVEYHFDSPEQVKLVALEFLQELPLL